MMGGVDERLFLEMFPFWESLPPSQQVMLLRASDLRAYREQEQVPAAGGAILVKQGELYGFISCENGSEATLFSVAERCVYLPPPEAAVTYICHIRTACESEIIHIADSAWRQLLCESPPACVYALEISYRFTQAILKTVYAQMFLPMEKRVAIFLQARMHSRTVMVMHSEMAMHLGTAREVISRALKTMADDGILKTGRGKIEILDVQKLKALAKQ